MTASPILTIDGLCAEAVNRDGSTQLLDGVALDVERGRMRGLVGETGSGKSMTAKSIVGLLPNGVRITGGSISFEGRELVGLREREWQAIRGPGIGMVFQNPRTALYPMSTVATQMGHVLRSHLSLGRDEARERIRSYLAMTGISDPDRVARAYPHELSGGMAQRVVIAIALILEPRLLIADEPTTGLDATVQRQILDLLRRLQRELDVAVLMITHDLGIVAHFCDDVTVMRGGRVVETGAVGSVLVKPSDAYTTTLIEASKLTSIREESGTR